MHSMRHAFLSVVIFAFLTISLLAVAQVPLQFVAITPCRVVDTRRANGPFGGPTLQAQTSRSFTIPEGACNVLATNLAAYSLNVTVVPRPTLGYLTIWPTGQTQPKISTLNSPDGRVKANAAIVPAGTNGAVSVFATDNTDVILDIDGYFVPATSSTLAFFPLTPCRVVDTRWTAGDLGGPTLKAGKERDFPLLESSCNIPGSAQGYSLNFTVVPHPTLGYLTVWPTGQSQPTVSTLNDTKGVVVANAAIVPAGTGGNISVYPTDNTDLIVDIDGYFAPSTAGQDPLSLYTLPPCRALDTRKGSGTFSGMIPVPVLASPCNVPSAQAYVLNATVIPYGGHSMGYLSLWPDAESQPVVSTLNAPDGTVTSNMAIVPTLNGSIDAYAQNPTDLVLDIFSYFAPITPLKITTTSLPSGTLHNGYNTELIASGGVPPYTWSLASGTLPPGLNPIPASGLITGTPTMNGTYPFTVEVTDSQTVPAVKSAPLSIVVNATVQQLNMVTTTLPAGTQNVGYNVVVAATGGVTPYVWSIAAGSLPPGLFLVANTGAITGTPYGGGTWTFSLQATDSESPAQAVSRQFSLTISPAVLLSITTTSLPSGSAGTAYSAAVVVIGGDYPYTWSLLSGTLPAGLGLNPITGVISGMPTAAGTSNFTVQATDSETPPVSASAPLSIIIQQGVVTITTTSLPAAPVNNPYSATLTASGGLTPYTWSIISGSLPAGLQLNASTGAITGLPTTLGTSNFTVKAVDSETPPSSATAPLSITVAPPSRIFTVLHNFAGPEGSTPSAPLVLATDGNFYGTDSYGGTGGGTFFRMTPSGAVTDLYNFCSQSGCADGNAPAGMVQATDGNFYGVTIDGGNNHDVGTAFKVTPGGALTTLYDFCSQETCPDGQYPAAIMQASDGNLYGVVATGGNGLGVFYQLTLGGTMTDLYSFDGSAGRAPGMKLVEGNDGQLYGTAPKGGQNGWGTVFKITLRGAATPLYSFCSQANCVDGAYPVSGLTLGSDGNFYGTTSGSYVTAGTVYKITPTGTLTTLYTFCVQTSCYDGNHPYGPVVQGSDGNFYGTTNSGGVYNYGTIFEITSSGTLTTLHSFNVADGINPTVRLVQDARGYFYGTTAKGGASNIGTVFSLSPPQ